MASELLFEEPRVLKAFSPELYRQLKLFYRQNLNPPVTAESGIIMRSFCRWVHRGQHR